MVRNSQYCRKKQEFKALIRIVLLNQSDGLPKSHRPWFGRATYVALEANQMRLAKLSKNLSSPL